MRGELADAIRDLQARRARGEIPPFRRILIESTGLADPFPVLSTIKADPVLRHHFRPGNVITTVDAVNGLRQLDTYVESNRQAAIADRLVITKRDMMPDGDAGALIDRLAALNPDAPVIDAGDADLDLASLICDDVAPRVAVLQSPSGFYCDAPQDLVDADGAAHSADFRSLVISVDQPVDWTAFGLWMTMLLNRHGDRVIRVKGILNIEGEDRPWPSMACSIWCTRRCTCRPGPVTTAARGSSLSLTGSTAIC